MKKAATIVIATGIIAAVAALSLLGLASPPGSVPELRARYGPALFRASAYQRDSEEFSGLNFVGVRQIERQNNEHSLLIFSTEPSLALTANEFLSYDAPRGILRRPAWYFPPAQIAIAAVGPAGELTSVDRYPRVSFVKLDASSHSPPLLLDIAAQLVQSDDMLGMARPDVVRLFGPSEPGRFDEMPSDWDDCFVLRRRHTGPMTVEMHSLVVKYDEEERVIRAELTVN